MMHWKLQLTRFAGVLVFVALNASAAKCTYSITPATAAMGFNGGAGAFVMTTGSSCAWAATSTNDWLHTTSAGPGEKPIYFTADPNPSQSARTGYLSAGDRTVSIVQAGMPVLLAEAVDASQLVWETSLDYPWFAVSPPAPTFDGVFAAASGNQFVQDSVSWIQTDVTGPGRLCFWWKVDSDATPEPPEEPWSFDYLEFLIDGEPQSRILWAEDWNFRAYDIPEGNHLVTWRYVKDPQYNFGEDRGWLDQVSFTTNAPVPLHLALDTTGVTWVSGGNSNPTYWIAQTNFSHDGEMSARSAAITHNQESWLEAVIVGATNVGFWWAVSSEPNLDWLEFWTNGVMVTRISGQTGWEYKEFKLTGQTNTVRWRFTKNPLDYLAKGQDAGWVDQVTFSPAPAVEPPTPFELTTPSILPDGSVQFSAIGQAGYAIEVQTSTNLLDWEILTSFTTETETSLITDARAPDFQARYYRAITR